MYYSAFWAPKHAFRWASFRLSCPMHSYFPYRSTSTDKVACSLRASENLTTRFRTSFRTGDQNEVSGLSRARQHHPKKSHRLSLYRSKSQHKVPLFFLACQNRTRRFWTFSVSIKVEQQSSRLISVLVGIRRWRSGLSLGPLVFGAPTCCPVG